MEFKQEQLESMSDFELSVVAAKLFLPCDYIVNDKNKSVELANYQDAMIHGMHDQVLTPYAGYNPCGSWSDCGDLIDDCNIGLDPTNFGGEVEWFARPEFRNEILTMDKNPKRAVTIAYILVKQSNG